MTQFVLPENVANRTLADMLRERAEQFGDRTALVGVSPTLGEQRPTYSGLLAKAQQLAAGFLNVGLKPGDHIGVMLGNEAAYEAVVSMEAVHQLGGVYLPVNTRFAIEEVIYILNKADVRCLVATAASAAPIKANWHRFTGLKYLIVIDEPADDLPWHVILNNATADPDRRPPSKPGDLSDILFTSGTTAHPKGAMLTHETGVASSYGCAIALGLRMGQDIYQSFMPVFTSGGVRCITQTAFWAAATLVFDPVLEIKSVIARIAREKTTTYLGTPAFYIFLLDQIGEDKHLVDSMRSFCFGGAPTTAETIRRLHEAFPKIEFRNAYGPTETGPAGTYVAGQELLDHPTSIGKAWPLVEIKCVDDDDNTVPNGERGEICTRGPCIMTGYWDEPEKTAEALLGGWHHTGDIGVIDEDGFLSIVDRKKDMLIRGGHNIASLEVESVLAEHPAVLEAAVVGVPHPKLGEDIHAFVLLCQGASATVEELREFCVDKLADYKRPRRITITDALPRGPMGKVLKSDLRTMAVDIGG